MGLVADGWPYYSASGDILPGVDHPFEFPDEVRKIKGGEIVEYLNPRSPVPFVVVMRSVSWRRAWPTGGCHAGCLPRPPPERQSPTAASSSSPSAAACAMKTPWLRKAGATFPTWQPRSSRRDSCTRSRDTKASRGISIRPGALVTGCRQEVDAYGSEAPLTPTIFELFRKEHALPPEEAWVIATNKSFGLMGGSKLRGFGDPYSANVVLPKQLLIETIKSAVSTNTGPGVEDRQALAERMMLALDEGYEGFGWKVFESGRTLGAGLKASLAKSLLDYFNDPTVPTSGDELTFFMTKEIMNRLAPSLLVVNFWDIDIAHYGAYLALPRGDQRTDRLVHELWLHAQSLPQVQQSHHTHRGARARTGWRRGRQRVREPPQRGRVVPSCVARGRRRRRPQGHAARCVDTTSRTELPSCRIDSRPPAATAAADGKACWKSTRQTRLDRAVTQLDPIASHSRPQPSRASAARTHR